MKRLVYEDVEKQQKMSHSSSKSLWTNKKSLQWEDEEMK
jgi:hypothetical protein